jgi:hypothetical protein
MPIIPNDEQFVGISHSHDLTEKGSAQTNSARTIYTYADIKSGLTFEWGDITGTLSNQTDLQNALDAKQETLVSATNIKTINGTSVLGSGDLPISGGGGGGGINSFTINAVFPFPTCASISSKSLSSVTVTANLIDYNLYVPAQDYTCTEFSVNVVTASTGVGRIMVYDNIHPTNNDGRPGALLYSSTDLDMTTTGVKTATTSFNFEAGKVYYLAVQAEATPRLTAIHKDSVIPIGLYFTGSSIVITLRQSNSAYSSGAPNPAGVNTFNMSSYPSLVMMNK